MPVSTDPAALAHTSTWRAGPPHPLLARLRAEAPVHWVPGDWGTQSSGGYWAVLTHEHVLEVARAAETYSSRSGAAYPCFEDEVADGAHNMMLQDGDEHRRLRGLAGRSFSPRVVARFDEWVRAITAEVLDDAYGMGRFDFVEEVAAAIPARVVAELMGVPDDDRAAVVRWSKAIFDRDTPAGRESGRKAMVALMRYAIQLRERKRVDPGVDLVSELVATEVEPGAMTDDDFRHYIMLVLAAGFETTHTLMAQTVRLLLQDDEIDGGARRAVAAGEVGALTEEFLRFVTPAMNMARFATRDTELGGRSIRAGQMVVMWLTAANRDPSVFASPDAFLPDRFPNNHVAFGAPGSPHYCLGHALGRLEGRVLLEDLLARPPLRLADAVEPSGGVFINALRAMPVEVV